MLLAGVLWLLVAWALLAGAPPAPRDPLTASCGPDGCFVAYFQRRTFLEAWRGCRELGGNLATLKHPEEAAQVRRMLQVPEGVDGTGQDQPQHQHQHPRRLLWIGLQRQARQCFPRRPLRGFTWTTGDQETHYTGWAPDAAPDGPPGSCTAPRCVALDDRTAQWRDGSCTAPVDGFLCRFAFRGMCHGLLDRTGVRYTTPFGPAGPGMQFVPFGTVAAVTCSGVASSGVMVSVLCLQKEDGAAGWSKAPPLCPSEEEEEEEDGVAPGYAPSWCEGDNGGCQQLCLDEGSGGYSCECHDGFRLLPDGHSCATITPQDHEGDACEGRPCAFGCVALDGGGYRCRCPVGYELGTDGHGCEDVDECAGDVPPCEHQCENTEGSFVCRCHLGFHPADDEDEEDGEPGRCADTDECQFPGVCQQMCVNYEGGFECFCTDGYELAGDGISCLPATHLLPSVAPDDAAPDGTYLQPFGWPPGRELDGRHYLGERWGDSAEPFPAFQDSPDTSAVPDPRVVPRMAPDTEPPNLNRDSLDWVPPPLEPRLTPPEHSRTPPPHLADPTTAPQRPARPLTLSTSPQSPSAPATMPPTPADLPDVRGGAAVWGVRAPPPTSAPPSPTPGEEGGRPKQDNRWLLVALLVPLCVFVVVMLALGIVYCTRCGAQAKARSVTQCYRWVISSAGKGGPPPAASRPCQAATCRTSV